MTLGDVEGLSLVVVEDPEAQRLLWNTLLAISSIPTARRRLPGASCATSSSRRMGVLGALGVSASALHLRARDAWMAMERGAAQEPICTVSCA